MAFRYHKTKVEGLNSSRDYQNGLKPPYKTCCWVREICKGLRRLVRCEEDASYIASDFYIVTYQVSTNNENTDLRDRVRYLAIHMAIMNEA
jgi:hypothetical protein